MREAELAVAAVEVEAAVQEVVAVAGIIPLALRCQHPCLPQIT